MTASHSVFDSSLGWIFGIKLSDEDIAAVGTTPRGRLSSWASAHILVVYNSLNCRSAARLFCRSTDCRRLTANLGRTDDTGQVATRRQIIYYHRLAKRIAKGEQNLWALFRDAVRTLITGIVAGVVIIDIVDMEMCCCCCCLHRLWRGTVFTAVCLSACLFATSRPITQKIMGGFLRNLRITR